MCTRKNAYIDSPKDMPKKCHYIIAKTRKLPKCPSKIEQVNTLHNSHTAMNMNKLQPNTTTYRKFNVEQKKPDQKYKQKNPYDYIIKVQKQAKVIYSGGSQGSFHPGGGQVVTARGTEQTSQMLIIFCLGLLAGYMGAFTS